MNINVAIGQFYPVESAIHKLDPRSKLMGTLAFIILLFIVNNFWGYVLAAAGLATVIKQSNVPPKYMLKGLKGLMFIIAFTIILNVFFSPGETVIFSWGIVEITKEGLLMALKMGTRLIMLVIGSSILTLTTSPIELTDGIERGLSPFKKIGLPAHEIAMMMTIALRFIPNLMEEVDRIMKAQIARGADFDTGGIKEKAKSLIPLLVPLFVSAFHRADDLAMAMEARCYRGDVNRSKMKEMKYTPADRVFLASFFLFSVLLVLTRMLPPLF